MATALTTMYSWLFPKEIIAEHKKTPIMWTAQTEYPSLPFFSFWRAKATWKDIFQTIYEFQIKAVENDKR